MNWRLEAKQKLQKLDAMRQAAANLPRELTLLRTEKDCPGGEKTLPEEHLHEKEYALRGALERTTAWLQTVEGAMGVLGPEERLILTRLYIYPERGAVNRLCGDLGVEQSSVYRRRDKALGKFTMALYGESGT